MRLHLITHAGRDQESFRNHDVGLYERAEFELVDLDQRVTCVLCVQGRYPGQIVVDRRKSVSSQEVRLAQQTISVVIALSSRL